MQKNKEAATRHQIPGRRIPADLSLYPWRNFILWAQTSGICIKPRVKNRADFLGDDHYWSGGRGGGAERGNFRNGFFPMELIKVSQLTKRPPMFFLYFLWPLPHRSLMVVPIIIVSKGCEQLTEKKIWWLSVRLSFLPCVCVLSDIYVHNWTL